MGTCIYTHMLRAYIHAWTCMYTYIHACIYTYIWIHMYIDLHKSVCIYMYVHMHIYIYLFVFMYMYVYGNIYIYICIHTYTLVYINIYTWYTYSYQVNITLCCWLVDLPCTCTCTCVRAHRDTHRHTDTSARPSTHPPTYTHTRRITEAVHLHTSMYRPDRVASAWSVDTSCCVRATGAGICVHVCVWRERARHSKSVHVCAQEIQHEMETDSNRARAREGDRATEQSNEQEKERGRETEKMSENNRGR